MAHGPKPRRGNRLSTAAALCALFGAAAVAPVVVAAPALAASNLLTNGGFEAGNLSGWSCSSLDSVVSSPVHSGSHALAGAANNSDNAQCTQAVSVQPSTAYTLTGWVEGNYVYIGDSGTGTNDTNNWTPSASTWQQLSTTFTTGASTTSVTVYVHGWYGQGTYFADDLSLTGPAGGGGGGSAPGAPSGLTVTGTTSSSVSLSWTAPSSGGAPSGYNVYENGTKVDSPTSTSDTIGGLAASTTYTFTVTAFNSVGESPQSSSVQATTQSSGGGGGGGGGGNLLTNGGFEAGNLSGWSCSSLDSVVSSPVHSGSHALAGAANNSDNAECDQTVSVQPNTAYTLTGWVEGNYVYIGAGSASNWTPSAASWQQLSTSFTTGSSATSVTVFVHGWYGQGTYFADDLSLTGPSGGGGGGSAPGAPSGLTVTGTTSSSVSLSWTAPSSGGAPSGYNVYENGTNVQSVTGTSDTVTGLAASTSYTFTVTAFNSVGESPHSSSVQATTQSSGGGGGGGGSLPAHVMAPYVDTGFSSVNGALSGSTLSTIASNYGDKYFSLAFVDGSGCQWSMFNSSMYQSEVSSLQAAGGNVIISFGGFNSDTNGTDLGNACSSASAMATQVENVVNFFNPAGLDFDIESSEVTNSADVNRTNAALAMVRSWANANGHSSLMIDYTLPVLTSGLTSDGLNVLTNGKSNGFTPNIVNVMAFDFGSSGTEMGQGAKQGLDSSASQVASTYGISNGYAMTGLTVMPGQNDTPGEVFTLSDASSVESYAASKGIPLLTFWSEGRDNGGCPGQTSASSTCSGLSQSTGQFTTTFNPFTH